MCELNPDSTEARLMQYSQSAGILLFDEYGIIHLSRFILADQTFAARLMSGGFPMF